MKLLIKSPFRRFVKKQSRPFQLVIEDEVEKVLNNPDIGEAKKGDLSGFNVHKLNFKGQQFLIAYLLACIIHKPSNQHRNSKIYY